jgi:hypothetical protein
VLRDYMLRLPSIISCLVSALFAFSILCLGLASAQMTASRLDPVLAAYVQAGGGLDDLCLSGDPPPGHGEHGDCAICALAQSLAVAEHQPVPHLNDLPVCRLSKLAQAAVSERRIGGIKAARAPPSA